MRAACAKEFKFLFEPCMSNLTTEITYHDIHAYFLTCKYGQKK